MNALRLATCEALPDLDEGYVATVKAYIQKAMDDKMDGLVEILRQLLQVFAAERLIAVVGSEFGAEEDAGVARVLRAALEVAPPAWEAKLKDELAGATDVRAVCLTGRG